jgi:hypothetical protein
MPLKVIADYRELLVDIFFAIIITIGFDGFLREFFIKSMHGLNAFDIPSLINVFSVHDKLIGISFFLVAYFWVISHWVFYHELITRYPYYNQWKFFVDVTLFSIMFVLINISYEAYDYEIAGLFILLLAIWYFFACLWHLSDKGLRPLGRYIIPHIYRMLTYIFLLVLLYDPLSVAQTIPSYRFLVLGGVIVAMTVWSADRLYKFVSRDIREYTCKYVEGYPGWNFERKGTLTLERHRMKANVEKDPEKKDRITFEPKKPKDEPKKPKDDTDKIVILAENVIAVRSGISPKRSSEYGLMLQIESSNINGANARIVFDLSDQVIEGHSGLKEGILEMSKDNRKEIFGL